MAFQDNHTIHQSIFPLHIVNLFSSHEKQWFILYFFFSFEGQRGRNSLVHSSNATAQQSTLGQAKARKLKFNPSLSHGWQHPYTEVIICCLSESESAGSRIRRERSRVWMCSPGTPVLAVSIPKDVSTAVLSICPRNDCFNPSIGFLRHRSSWFRIFCNSIYPNQIISLTEIYFVQWTKRIL